MSDHEQFEYDHINVRTIDGDRRTAVASRAGDHQGSGLLDILNKYGAEGWEVVHVSFWDALREADILVKRRIKS